MEDHDDKQQICEELEALAAGLDHGDIRSRAPYGRVIIVKPPTSTSAPPKSTWPPPSGSRRPQERGRWTMWPT